MRSVPSLDGRAAAFALRLDGSNSDIVQLPPELARRSRIDATWNITLKEDGAGDLVGDENTAAMEPSGFARTSPSKPRARSTSKRASSADGLARSS